MHFWSIWRVCHGLERLKSLKCNIRNILTIKITTVARFNKLLYQNHGERMVDLYGAAEAAIYASYFDCPTDLELRKT